MSWHRTACSILILALLMAKSGFYRGHAVLILMGSISALLTLALVVNTLSHQQKRLWHTELILRKTNSAKQLICAALFLNALAVVLSSVIRLY